MTFYCHTIEKMPDGPRRELHQRYHDLFYGFPLNDDDELFGRLVLEINQAGLSWETILRKEENFRNAFCQFNISRVAAYTDDDILRLLTDPGIIRNRRKIEAVIYNARVIQGLQSEFGTFYNWLEAQHPRSLDAWVKLFKTTFRFTGREIVNEFLMSTGYLPGAHDPACPVHQKIVRQNPGWLKSMHTGR